MTTYTQAAAQAFTRFGFGGRPDDQIPADPIAWLTTQVTGPDATPVSTMPTLQQGLTLWNSWISVPRNSPQELAWAAQARANMAMEQQTFLANAVTTTTPFRERLVWFWANHYAIMAGSGGQMLLTSGPYVRDGIRANMTGTIAQMLQATVLHPAMVFSLNAIASFGPQSPRALGMAKHGNAVTINENLGRETLELYSVGIDAGYTQADVDALAYLLSGLDVNSAPGAPLGTYYNFQKQQPGNFTLMGTTYPGTLPGLMGALQTLGTHPATYQHLATKLVSHFTSDTPSAADVATVYAALASTGGSLPAAHQALIGLQNAWVPFQKLRTPADLVVASLRAANVTAATIPTWAGNALTAMGQPTWYPPFPNGWSDQAASWTGPGPCLLRARFANQLAHYLPGVSPAQALAASLGPLATSSTASAVGAVSNQQEQLTLLFCSPEFQRR